MSKTKMNFFQSIIRISANSLSEICKKPSLFQIILDHLSLDRECRRNQLFKTVGLIGLYHFAPAYPAYSHRIYNLLLDG